MALASRMDGIDTKLQIARLYFFVFLLIIPDAGN
jgi:hypothetical protein